MHLCVAVATAPFLTHSLAHSIYAEHTQNNPFLMCFAVEAPDAVRRCKVYTRILAIRECVFSGVGTRSLHGIFALAPPQNEWYA